MKPVILALVALIILGAGGAGAYFYFKQPAQAAIGADGEHQEAAKAKDHDKKKGGDHGAGVSAFVQLDPLILPIIGKDGLSQVVSVVVVIETTDEATKAEIEHLSPRLKDAFIQDMYGVLSDETIMRGGVIQVTTLKDRLYKISNHVLGEGKATQVLLQVVQQRPI